MTFANVLGLTAKEFKEKIVSLGEKPFRAAQVWQWLYNRRIHTWSQMTDLPTSLRKTWEAQFVLGSLQLEKTQESFDRETTKFLWKLVDGRFVESVLIRAPDRCTVCVSSQVGCAARCAFCASGKNGWVRNLEASEILEQVYHIDNWLSKHEGKRVSHVVFMGMGEPMENYENVVKAVRLLSDPQGLHISQRRLTISTVGVIPGILRFADEGLKTNLVLSLHAPNQKLRQKIIPYARRYALLDILEAMREFAVKTKRDVTYEYTLLQDINDQPEHAKELVELLRGDQCTVNLIPYNPVDGLRLNRPSREAIERFREILEEGGLNTTWRYTKGKDIAAACGQLALQEASSVEEQTFVKNQGLVVVN